MSARRLPVRFAPEAQEDIEDILNYTRERWGARQRIIYRNALNATLRGNPDIGRARDDLLVGVRTWPVEQHMVLYRVDDDAIRILRVIYQRMDLTGTLKS